MSARRPLIGLTPDQEVPEGQPTEAQYLVRSNYAGAVLAAGGIPVILPYAMAAVADFVAGIDGFLITGGTPGVSVSLLQQKLYFASNTYFMDWTRIG